MHDLKDKTLSVHSDGLDRLSLMPVPLVPEIRLHLAVDAIVWWARMEAEAGQALATPFWASAWAGGQGVARYVLDNPEVAHGRRVLDLAAGSGLVGIAAALAGAATVTANDIDPYAIAAVELNARANGVTVTGRQGDLLDGDGGDADLVLAGDVFYSDEMAERVMPFLRRAADRGARVLVGDPGRDYLPTTELALVATYDTGSALTFVDAQLHRVNVFQLGG
ncbi:class I SAM-dependent methyltransferase [Catellatospora vulcania]|uniref:class I SAM-dependent methyltransferase n=1 Tax=Catellatospora vulcania TaxID=1460450 RepID=UPI0012D3ECCC|nr:50S ribosomal protein L11 methyltransferase [Catellatospora vulcania]